MASDQWAVFNYEVDQFNAMCDLLRANHPVTPLLSQPVRNAFVESALIHTRIITQILLSEGWPSDIKLDALLPSFTTPNVQRLKDAYGENSDSGSPRSTLNKLLAHSDKSRTDSHNYSAPLNLLVPIIRDLLLEIETHRASCGS